MFLLSFNLQHFYWLNTLTPSKWERYINVTFLALIRLKWLQFSLILKMLFIIVFLGFKCIYLQIFTCYVVNLDSVGLKRKLNLKFSTRSAASAPLQHICKVFNKSINITAVSQFSCEMKEYLGLRF